MSERQVSAEGVEHQARQAGFGLPAGGAEKRAAQIARLIDEAETLRRLPLGTTAPATPWPAPRDD